MKKEKTEIKGFNPHDNIHMLLDSIEKNYSLTMGSVFPGEVRQSTGLLALDLIIGGGITPGMYTTFGPEQSCKSTLTAQIMLACIQSDIPVKAIFDAEGSFDPVYFESMAKTWGLNYKTEDIVGIQDPKTQKWLKAPIVRYYDTNIGETLFDYIAKLQRELPDKRYMEGAWWYIYENTKKNKDIVGTNYCTKYFSRTGKLRVLAEDGKLQALILADSWPAFLPEKQDVDDPGSAIAVQARMYSDNIKRIKGKLRSKRIALLGVNQLRSVPMAMFGPPETEPGGQALKFYCFAADTLIRTPGGLMYAHEIDKNNIPVIDSYTTFVQPTVFDVVDRGKAIKVTTSLGYTLTASEKHRIIVGKDWKKFSELSINDGVTIKACSLHYDAINYEGNDVDIIRRSSRASQIRWLKEVDTSDPTIVTLIHQMWLSLGRIYKKSPSYRYDKTKFSIKTSFFEDVIESIEILPEQDFYDFSSPNKTVITSGFVSHNSDVRLRATPRAISGSPISGFVGKGMLIEENSIVSGKDSYRLIHVKAIKNKLSVPYLETWIRLWIEDGKGKAKGLDPVFDTYMYLRMTGQITGNVKKLKLTIRNETFEISWITLKRWILGSKEEHKKMGIKFNLRSFCEKQMVSGDGLKMFLEHRSKSRTTDEE